MSELFSKCVQKVLGIEGKYSYDPRDAGGETMWGITKRLASHYGYVGSMIKMPKEFAVDVYKREFWDKLGGDELGKRGQLLVQEIFEAAVNVGIKPISEWLQQSLNLLTLGRTYYPTVSVDGDIGSETLNALSFLPSEDIPELIKLVQLHQGMHYIHLVKRDLTQAAFLRGWLSRVNLA